LGWTHHARINITRTSTTTSHGASSLVHSTHSCAWPGAEQRVHPLWRLLLLLWRLLLLLWRLLLLPLLLMWRNFQRVRCC
jgi:hypothetical protein